MNLADEKKITTDTYGVDAPLGVEKLAGDGKPVKHLEHVEGQTTEQEWQNILQDAIDSEAQERALGWKKALKLYPQACFWSFAISLCIVM